MPARCSIEIGFCVSYWFDLEQRVAFIGRPYHPPYELNLVLYPFFGVWWRCLPQGLQSTGVQSETLSIPNRFRWLRAR